MVRQARRRSGRPTSAFAQPPTIPPLGGRRERERSRTPRLVMCRASQSLRLGWYRTHSELAPYWLQLARIPKPGREWSWPGFRIRPSVATGQGQGMVHLTVFELVRSHVTTGALHRAEQTSALPDPPSGNESMPPSTATTRTGHGPESAGAQPAPITTPRHKSQTRRWSTAHIALGRYYGPFS